MMYLDTSAIIELIIEEPESTALHEVLSDDETPPLFTSQLAVTEVKRALHAHGETELAANVLGPSATLVVSGHAILTRPLPLELVVAAGDLLPSSLLRSLDAIHLATAMTAGETLNAVVTYDTRMIDAATKVGITALAPEKKEAHPRRQS